jgi:hypothetical protein
MTSSHAQLEPWPELSEFLRALVRDEVDAQKTATTDGLIDFIRKHVRVEVDAAVGAAVDGLIDEIAATAPVAVARTSRTPPAPAPAPRQRSSSKWLTAQRAGRIAGVHATTIRSWVRAGQLRRYGTHRRILVLREDLDQLLARGYDPRTRRASAPNGHAP